MSGAFIRMTLTVAKGEWCALRRSQTARIAALLLLALTIAATVVSMDRMHSIGAERAEAQRSADQEFKEQPARHPHRVVHYGHYIFRPAPPLAFFDFGVDAYTGHSLFLEGHRQNSANFGGAMQSSLLIRFGQLTPAFVLQTITPLLIVFLAFGSIAREREVGQLRLLLAQGGDIRAVVAGKLLCHAAVALLLAAPAIVALLAAGFMNPDWLGRAAWLAALYTGYLLLWSAAAVLISALSAHARDALVALAACWMITVLLLPRVMPDIASAMAPRATRIEAEVALHKEVAALGDSHDANDPHFAQFRARTLAKYGVTKVEDLPVNYGGLVIEEGERLASALYERHMLADFASQAAQHAIVMMAAIPSPVIALRSASGALAGTGRDAHQHFLLEGERYRYAMVQALNRLHVSQIRYKNDRDQRIGQQHWQELPRFAHVAPPVAVGARVLPAAGLLGLWLAAMALLILPVSKRLERSIR